jgi:hypothetical protein
MCVKHIGAGLLFGTTTRALSTNGQARWSTYIKHAGLTRFLISSVGLLEAVLDMT